MASRRTAPSEKTVLEQQGGPPASSLNTDTSSVVETAVLLKLLGFSVAMLALPISSYFAAFYIFFSGNATYSGAFAAVMANVVLIAYIVVAMREDQSDQLELEKERKKGQ